MGAGHSQAGSPCLTVSLRVKPNWGFLLSLKPAEHEMKQRGASTVEHKGRWDKSWPGVRFPNNCFYFPGTVSEPGSKPSAYINSINPDTL